MSAAPDPVAATRALRPLFEAEALAVDEKLTLTPKVVEAAADAGLFQLMVPKEFGGIEADASTLLDVFEEMAIADGSIGWTLMANASATSYVSFLDPAVAAEMVQGRPDSTTAGQFSPFGTVKRDGEGYRVTGDFQFGSGSGHASYIGGAGFVTGDDGNPEMMEDGLPNYRCFFVPKDGVEMKGGWDVMGLRGTGSYDYHIKEQVIAPGQTFGLFHYEVKTGGPLFGMGPAPLAGLGHAGWGLGVARRALDEIEQIAEGGRARMGGLALRDQQYFQRELGKREMALQSVRLLSHDVFGRVIEHLSKGDAMTPALQQEVMASTAYLTEVAEDCTLFAYRSAGSQGLRNPSAVQRCFRDIFTGGLHIFVDRRSYEEIAKGRTGVTA